jgi:hypothetical protein
MGSIHAGCPLFPLQLYPSDTTRERPTRAGIERLRHNSRHNSSRCAASIASGQAAGYALRAEIQRVEFAMFQFT